MGLLVIASFCSSRPLGDGEIKCRWKMWDYRPSTPKNSSPRAALKSPVEEKAGQTYDAFLKRNDQELGIRSYGACVDLLVAWERTKNETNR